MNRAWSAMDVDAIRASFANKDALPSYDLDLRGAPIRFSSRDDVVRYAERVFAEMRKMGATMRLSVHDLQCRANATLGVCAQEFDAEVTLGDGTKEAWSFRGTGAARKEEDGWRWTHWHASLAKMPQLPGATTPASPSAPAPEGRREP